MKTRIARSVLVLLTALTIFSGAAPSARAGFLMWQAQKDGQTIHLLADVRFLAPGSVNTLASEIEDAIHVSTLVLLESEMGIEQRKAERREIIAAASYPPEDNLLNHLPRDVVAQFNRLCEKLTIQPRGFVGTKPWAAAHNLNTVALSKLAIPQDNKLDAAVYNRALAENKPVTFAMNADDLIATYAALPHDTDVRVFAKALRDIDTMTESISVREAAWNSADAEAAASIVDASNADFADVQKALQPLQRIWLEKLTGSLASNDNVFALVSLDRLAGKDNLLKALEARGFTIAQVIPD